MGMIEFQDGAIEVGAAIIAEGLGMEPETLQERMREGSITSRCEQGIDADQGRYRLTFFADSRRFRLVIDRTGKVLQRSTIDFGNRSLPGSARNVGS